MMFDFIKWLEQQASTEHYISFTESDWQRTKYASEALQEIERLQALVVENKHR